MNSEKSKSVTTQIRLSSELHEQIKDAANRSGRSMNAEIVRRLSGMEDGDAISELKARLRLAEGYNRERLLTVINQLLDYLASPNRTAEAERDLLILLVRAQSEVSDKLTPKLPPV